MFTGEIVRWIKTPSRPSFGFARMPNGREVYVSAVCFSSRDHIARVDVGTTIEFEMRSNKVDQAMLNAGLLRDKPNRNHRNPRRIAVKGQKPQAINVRIVDEIVAA